MDKQQLRKKYKKLRGALTDDEREAMSLEIANQALRLEIWDYEYYHIFLPIERLREINTEYLLHILSGKDKNIVLSKSNFETLELQHFLLTDSTKIVINEYGIPEPVDGIEIDPLKIEVAFIPLLACDKQGNRVGYGKGFYDRFLQSWSPDVMSVGLSFFDPENDIIPTNNTDMPLKHLISVKNVYNF